MLSPHVFWRAKAKAFGVHFILTAVVAVVAALLVFRGWFAAPMDAMLGATTLFVLVVGCDLVLGPLMSLVIYNPAKPRKVLLSDYAVVVVLQLAALVYGLHVVAQVRPLFLVFTIDRYVVVNAGELPNEELRKIPDQTLRPGFWSGYRPVYVERVTDPKAGFELAFSALGGGRDLQHVAENYRPVSEHVSEIAQAARPLALLRQKFARQAPAVEQAVQQAGLPEDALRWLPVQAQSSEGAIFWTVLIDPRTALPVGWIHLDPL